MATTLREVDAILIRYADTESAEAISFRIEGILTPKQVAARIDQLLAAPDRLSMLQQDQLITLKMRQVVNQLEETMSGGHVTARTAEVVLGGLEKIGNRLDKRQESTERELKSLYAFQGVAFLDAVIEALNFIKQNAVGADKIPEEEWDRHLENATRKAQLSLAVHDIDNAIPTTAYDVEDVIQ